jgi:hypothetical protein
MADAREQFESYLNGGAGIDRILDAARKVPDLNLHDAIRITSLMSILHDPRFDRAAARLAARITLAYDLTIEQAADAIVLAAELPDLDAEFKLTVMVKGPPKRDERHVRPLERY